MAIRIRVGAAIDTSLASLVPSIKAIAAKATAVMTAEAQKGAAAQAAAAKKSGDAIAKEAERASAKAAAAMAKMSSEAERTAYKEAAAAERAAQKKVAADLRAFDARIRASARASAAEERDILRVAATAEKAAARAAAADAKAARQSRSQFVRDAGGTLGGLARGAGRVGMDVARGAGVNFDLSSLVGKSVHAQKTAMDIVNSQAAAENRVAKPGEANALVAQVRNVADSVSVDTNIALDGLQEFVSKSADLKTGVASLGEMAELARATGSNLKDVVGAAGEVNTQLADTPDKAERLMTILRLVAKQGALGSVEIRDMAKLMGRLAAAAPKFGGSIEQNIGILGAITQMAKKSGGATTATEATGAASAFVRDLVKPNQLKRLKAAGINVFNEEGNFHGADKIMQAALHRTGGDQAKLAALFQNAKSMQAIAGFAQIYRNAENARKKSGGVGVTGLEAVQSEFGKYTSGMSKEDVSAAAKNSLGTTESNVQRFNNALERTAETLAGQLLPKMNDLAPAMLSLASGVASAAGFLSNNVGTAITGAIALSIGKAGIQQALTAGFSSGNIALTAAALTIVAATVILAAAAGNRTKGREAAANELDTHESRLAAAEKEFKDTGTLSPATRARLEKEGASIKSTIAATPVAAEEKGMFGKVVSNIHAAVSPEYGAKQGQEAANREMIGTLNNELKGIRSILEAANKKPIKVEVNITGAPDGVDPTARTGPDT